MDKLLKKTSKYLRKHEGTHAANILGELVAALDAGTEFKLTKLYELPYDAFELALQLLKEWRLASYTCKSGDLPNAIAVGATRFGTNWLAGEADDVGWPM